MRTHEFINEIVYSSSISDSTNILKALDPHIDEKVGIVDHHTVHIKDGGNCIIFYLSNDSKVVCYLIIEKENIEGYYPFRQAEKIVNIPGAMMALVQFLISDNIKLIIKNNEPMTLNGLKWVSGLINNPRGLNIHDGQNNKINLEELHKEWETSFDNIGHSGNIKIFIESRQNKNDYCFEDQTNINGLLKNPYRYINDLTLD